jgi:hypothetical protein
MERQRNKRLAAVKCGFFLVANKVSNKGCPFPKNKAQMEYALVGKSGITVRLLIFFTDETTNLRP